jgi:caffeoyl-CoA O-methyltransferase
MSRKQGVRRREFIEITGGALGFLTGMCAVSPGLQAGVKAHDIMKVPCREAPPLRAGSFTAGPQIRSAMGNPQTGETGPVRRDPGQLKRLLEKMEAKGYQYWSVPRKDGELLRFLVKAARVKNVLEIGTSHGFSAIWIGLGLEETGGRLTTIEIDKDRHLLARKNLGDAGLLQRVTLILGDAHAEVAKLDGPFDFVFLDADKEGQGDYFNKLYPKKLLPGGLLVSHNAIRQADSMRDYLDLVQKHPDFDSIIVSATMDDGFCLSYRHRY